MPDSEAAMLLGRLRDLLEGARGMPLSDAAIVGRDDALGLLDAIASCLPTEVTEARLVLEEREHTIASARREAAGIIEAARSQVEGMVRRTEIAREARLQAVSTVESAEAEGRRRRREAQSYAAERLREVEVVLEETLAELRRGRERLGLERAPVTSERSATGTGGLFDQDRQ